MLTYEYITFPSITNQKLSFSKHKHERLAFPQIAQKHSSNSLIVFQTAV